MDIMEIRDIIPHRYPLLLVDKIIEYEEGKRMVGVKNVSANEPVFQGHFPDFPLFPGVYIVEAMAQVGGIMIAKSLKLEKGKYTIVFAGIENARFKKPVFPGDQLILELEALTLRKRLSKAKGTAKVDGEVVAEAVIYASAVRVDEIKR